MNKITNFYPPKTWITSLGDKTNINAYKFLLKNYSESDVVAKIHKNNKTIKVLTKKDIEKSVKLLAYKILKLIDNKNQEQIKIFGIMGASEESLILMLTSAFLSAHHSICFEELSESAILDRIEIFKPDIIFYKKHLINKVENINLDKISKKINLYSFDIDQLNRENISKTENHLINSLEPKIYDYSDSFFTLYTSGSTGKPKAIVHCTKKYLEFSKFTTEYFFNLNKNSIIFTATDVGWINGHTYAVYGPLSCSAVTIIFENLQSLSDANFLNDLINKNGITCLYLSVTLLRILRSNSRYTNSQKINNHKLDRIGSCGEPLANAVGAWAISFFQPKRKTIVNTFFQTETGGILIAPRDEDGIPSDYSSVGKPRKELGVFIAKDQLSDDLLREENIEPNEILVKNPWGGIFQKVLSDRPIDYFTSQGYFRFHDIGFYDDQGFLYIGGRSDDVINSAGHRISSSEIESVCLSIEEIKEACVVAISDFLIGEKPILFISTNKKLLICESELKSKIIDSIEKKLTKYHQPFEINIFQNIPKTKSGKIMRRLMRQLCQKLIIDQSKDYSTIANKEEFNHSKQIFLNEKINYYCSRNNIYFDLYEFADRCGIRFEICEILSSLVVYFNEEISRKISKLHISEINFTETEFDLNFSYKINNNDNLINLKNQFLNFLIKYKHNSKEFKNIIISFILDDEKYIRLFLNRNKDYNFNIEFNTDSTEESISKRKELINNFLNNFNLQKNNSNFDRNIKNKKINLKCSSCNSSLLEIKRLRGNEAYLCNVINTDGQNTYICDLCLQGY